MKLLAKAVGRMAAAATITFLLVGSTGAHVHLHEPNGGEEFEAGSVVTVRWEIQVSHNTENWDLWYSTTGDAGPWIPIAMNLPAGDISEGAIHTFAWAVPNTLSTQCRVRVRQDNSGTDWEDISDANFSIVPAPTLPEGSKLNDGVIVSGQMSDLFDSDDQYFELDPSPTQNLLKQKVHLILQATSPTESPSSFKFRLEAAMMGGPSGDVVQYLELFNYDTGVLEQVDVRSAANNDDSIEVTPSGDLSRFVQPATREITAEITWKSESFAGAQFNWSIDVDEAVWEVSD